MQRWRWNPNGEASSWDESPFLAEISLSGLLRFFFSLLFKTEGSSLVTHESTSWNGHCIYGVMGFSTSCKYKSYELCDTIRYVSYRMIHIWIVRFSPVYDSNIRYESLWVRYDTNRRELYDFNNHDRAIWYVSYRTIHIWIVWFSHVYDSNMRYESFWVRYNTNRIVNCTI